MRLRLKVLDTITAMLALLSCLIMYYSNEEYMTSMDVDADAWMPTNNNNTTVLTLRTLNLVITLLVGMFIMIRTYYEL